MKIAAPPSKSMSPMQDEAKPRRNGHMKQHMQSITARLDRQLVRVRALYVYEQFESPKITLPMSGQAHGLRLQIPTYIWVLYYG